jgi:CelD/BcsL family acetyltransferase involved in cellulose biosynthesis
VTRAYAPTDFKRLPGPPVLAVAGLPDAIDDAAARCTLGRHLRAAWYRAALVAYGGRDARTLIAYDGDGRAAIALPLVSAGPERLGLAAVPGCYWPYRGFPIADDAAPEQLRALLRGMAASVRAWRLGPIPADDPVLARLRAELDASGWVLHERAIAPRFILDIAAVRAGGQWPRGSTLRKNRFHEKHLAGHGALGWSFHAGRDWSAALFDDLATIEAASWIASRTDGADAKFYDSAHGEFWREAAGDPVIAAMMHAALLRVDGAPAAFSFDLDAGGVKHAIANSYDPRFARHSPGKLLYYRNLEEGIARGLMRVDWGAGDSGYKRVIGAEAAAPILDCLFVRKGIAAAAVGWFWRRGAII